MRIVAPLIPLLLSTSVFATTFDLPSEHFDVIGAVTVVQATYEDTLLDIARRKSIGQE